MTTPEFTVPDADIEKYAIEMAADAIESCAEDDMDEDGVFDSELPDGDANSWDFKDHDGHEAACSLAIALANAIRENPVHFLTWARAHGVKTAAECREQARVHRENRPY